MRVYQWAPPEHFEETSRFLRVLNSKSGGDRITMIRSTRDIVPHDGLTMVVQFPDLAYLQDLDETFTPEPPSGILFAPLILDQSVPRSHAWYGKIKPKEEQHQSVMMDLFVGGIWNENRLSNQLSLVRRPETGKLVFCWRSTTPRVLLTQPWKKIRPMGIDALSVLTKDQIDRFQKRVPHIEIITVPKRRAHVQTFIDTHCLYQATIFPAVRPKKGTPFLNVGETGCFLSHIAVFEKYKDSPPTTHVLILEDDVQVSHHLQGMWIGYAIMEFLEDLPRNWEFVYLGYCLDNCRNQRQGPQKRYLIGDRPFCSHAYLIRVSAIQKLLSGNVRPHAKPYDHFLSGALKKANIEPYLPPDYTMFDQDPGLQSTIVNPWDTMLRNHIFQPRCIESVYTPGNFVLMVFMVFAVLLLIGSVYESM